MGHDLRKVFGNERPLLIENVNIPPELRVLSFAPHPDDFDAVCATMSHLRDNGNEIFVGVVSGSWSGVEDGFGGAMTPEEKNAVREQEQLASTRYFGLPDANLTFLRLHENDNGNPVDDDSNYEVVLAYFRKIRPDLIFCPHGNDPNGGHSASYWLARRAAQELGRPALMLLNRDPKSINLRHDLYTPFTEDIAKAKRDQLKLHLSQETRNQNTRGHGVDERVFKVNRMIAETYLPESPYAEVFELEFID